MAERTFISFDWAIKKILRHKENFTVLEGFLSELLGFDIKIQNLLESEANKQHAEAKHILRYENMQKEDQISYKRHIENRRIEMGVMETAIDRAERRKAIEVAKVLVATGTDKNIIALATKLTMEELSKIERGEELDKEDDDE